MRELDCLKGLVFRRFRPESGEKENPKNPVNPV